MNESRSSLADSGVGQYAVATAAPRGWLSALLGAMAVLALAAPAGAVTQVDCNTPNDFCVGDPCVTKDELQITVPSCVLDFGARALVLSQVVFVPNGGSLTLSAGSIEIRRRI